MNKIVLFDPSVKTFNMGDHIIMQSIENELSELLDGCFVIKVGTHTPPITFYQNVRQNPEIKLFDDINYKFICGSNLLWRNMFKPRPSLNINIFNYKPYKNSILVGIGTNSQKTNYYTKHLYKKILSKDFIHSARDEVAKEFIESLGFKAINTGCATMWKFTKEFCKQIPTKKSDNVIFTLTDYKKDSNNDKQMIKILKENYNKVYFWIQGMGDEEYFDSLKISDGIIKINPTIKDYEKVLNLGNIDYVGTRLHGGIFAMQHKIRSIIVAIDNRVRDMSKTYNLNTIERLDIPNNLEKLINSNIETDVLINEKNISLWLSQFK